MKKWYYSKTMWFQIVTLIGLVANEPNIIVTFERWYLLLIPVINVILRKYTGEVIENKLL